MDIEQVARVVTLVESSQVYEVTIADNGQSITVVNNVNQKNAASPIDTIAIEKRVENDRSLAQICVTHVGRIYLSEDGATDPLVSNGAHIKKGQTICFIEELSQLLPVISDKEGVVSDILVEDGQNVEYGQPVFNLEI